jgi:hypothetical protein
MTENVVFLTWPNHGTRKIYKDSVITYIKTITESEWKSVYIGTKILTGEYDVCLQNNKIFLVSI